MNTRPCYRYIPLYLNDKLWKYVYFDVSRMYDHVSIKCLPYKVSEKARQLEKNGYAHGHQFCTMIDFVPRSIPIGPGLNEVRLYGVHSCLRVVASDSLRSTPMLEYDVPDDPEDKYYERFRNS